MLYAAVIVTLGPSCHEVDTLCQLLQSGATCARIDLTVSHLQAQYAATAQLITLPSWHV